MIEALGGALAGILITYFEKHSIGPKKIFVISFLAFTVLFWLCYFFFEFNPENGLAKVILYGLGFGLFSATFLTALHSLYKRYIRKGDKSYK